MTRFNRGLAAALLVPALAQAVPEGPAYPSPAWAEREAQNYARVLQAPAEQASNPTFVTRWTLQSQSNFESYALRGVLDPSWLIGLSGNTPVTPLCTTWSLQCAGDPFRYDGVDGPDGTPFYANEADVQPVVWYDRQCARISGRVWAPKNADPAHGLPAVVIENGSVEAPETLYWWAAQALVRSGYVVLTFDPRGQGRSDLQSPSLGQGGNVDPSVFWDGLVDAIDFFRSRPARPYPHNQSCKGTYPTGVARFNPYHARIDRARLGIAGHSLGATGVSVVQGYGAAGADPWPGLIDAANPVKVAVAWDGLSVPAGATTGGGPTSAVPGLTALLGPLVERGQPAVVPRVPAMGHSSEYGLTPTPFLQAPDPEGHKAAFSAWKASGIPAYEIVIQGSSHYEWSLIPSFPTTSWCASTAGNACSGGWGNPMAEHYTLAWFDRWLKKPGEPGYRTADRRLLDDGGEQGTAKMSFYFRSARAFPDRRGREQDCEDIRGGC